MKALPNSFAASTRAFVCSGVSFGVYARPGNSLRFNVPARADLPGDLRLLGADTTPTAVAPSSFVIWHGEDAEAPARRPR